jgi:hypothetical protein
MPITVAMFTSRDDDAIVVKALSTKLMSSLPKVKYAEAAYLF